MANLYIVLIVNEWGQVFERDGTLYRSDSGRPHFQQTFSDLTLAKQFAYAVVSELPHVGCEIVCGEEIVFQHFDAEWRRAKGEQMLRMSSLQRRQSRRVVYAIIGAVMLTISGAMVYFAYGRAA